MTTGMYEIHPAFRPSLLLAAQHAVRMGALPETANGRVLSATKDGTALSVWVAPNNDKAEVIKTAQYQVYGHSEETKGLFEIFATTIEGLPLQEAADHGTLHVCDRLRQGIVGGPLVRGIHTPASMGTAFRRCDYLIRNITTQYNTAIGNANTSNFWYPSLSPGWHLAKRDQQRAILQLIVGKFCTENNFAAGSIRVTRLEKTRRVIVDLSETFDATKKPSVLMQLERLVRAITGERLEIYLEELVDDHRLRRLGTTPIRGVA